MNKVVPRLLIAEGQALSVTPGAEVDFREQEEFATSLLHDPTGDLGDLRSGLPALHQEALLPGWYDDWVVFERERLSQLRLRALEITAHLFIQYGDLDTALELALEAVRVEPLRETANAALIAVYLAEGNAYDALSHYEAFRERLARELGLSPSPRLVAMLPHRSSTRV